MRIKLDNLDDRDGCVMVTTDEGAAAPIDQTIGGASWEALGSEFAYAMPMDRPNLVAELTAEGYDIDDSEYFPL